MRLFRDLGATEDASTVAMRLIPRHIASVLQFYGYLEPYRKEGDWAVITTTPDTKGQEYGYAIPVSDRYRAQPVLTPMFLEIHTVLVAWWLTIAWRVQQLSRAGSSLAEAGDVVAAAACVRPLVESAAALWSDGNSVVSAWDEMKRGGDPLRQDSALPQRDAFMETLSQIIWGAKFDSRSPELQQTFKRFSRTNVLTQVDRLAKVTPAGLQDDYQWLCNTVHPSLGTTFAMAAPPLQHASRTHMLFWYAGRPIFFEGPHGREAEDSVETAVARAATVVLRVLRITFDSLLRTIDDVALTTHAPTVSRNRYWRSIEAGGRNERCPCRSGRKVKQCHHEWGDPAPAFPADFVSGNGTAS